MHLANYAKMSRDLVEVRGIPKARARWIATEWPRIKRLARSQRALLFFEDESVVRLTPTVGRTWAPVGKTPIVRVTGKRAKLSALN